MVPVLQQLTFHLGDACNIHMLLTCAGPSVSNALRHLFPSFALSSFNMLLETELHVFSPPPPPVILGPHLLHMEVPRLRVASELQLPAYTTATATPDPQPTE